MKNKHCKLGINHHLIFPGVLNDAKYHIESLSLLLEQDSFQIIDMSLPDDREIRSEEVKMLKSSGKKVIYNFPLFCLGSDRYDVNSPEKSVRLATLEEAKKNLLYAVEAETDTVTFAAGGFKEGISLEAQINNFIEYSILFNEEAKKLGITALLEPFDRSIGKNLILGKAAECVDYIEALHKSGCENIALMQDMGHIPLIGESFEETLNKCKPYLKHIHLGNCVMKDKESIYYGDTHPPLGIDGGENDMPQLIAFTKALKDIGYIFKGSDNSVTIEMQPYPGVSSLTSAKVAAEKFESALSAVFD